MFKKTKKENKGYTLLEIMISLTIFAAMALFVADIYVTVMRYYMGSIANRTAQQDSKIALETITRYVKQAVYFDWSSVQKRLTLSVKDDTGAQKYVIFDQETVVSGSDSYGVIKMQIKNSLSEADSSESLTTEDLDVNLFEISASPGIPVILGIKIEADITNASDRNIERGLVGENRIFLETNVAIKGQYNF